MWEREYILRWMENGGQTSFARDYNDCLGIKRRILKQMSVIDFCKNSAHPYTKTATM